MMRWNSTRMNDREPMVGEMLRARRRHLMGYLATDAALDEFAALIARWRRGEIEASRVIGRPLRSEGIAGREDTVESLLARFEERRPISRLRPFASRRLRHRLARLIAEAAPPRDVLERLERQARNEASPFARRSMDRRRRAFEAARNVAVEAHIDIVDRVVGRYLNTPLGREDLVQEGRAGLLRAAESFDPAEGCPFGAYARFWIRHAILDALARSTRLIRLPHWLNSALTRQARNPESATDATTSLEPQVGGLDDDQGYGIAIADRAGDAADVAEKAELSERARELLAELPERERSIVSQRFGLDGREERSRGDLAQAYGLSPQRIGQIERDALALLRRRLETAM